MLIVTSPVQKVSMKNYEIMTIYKSDLGEEKAKDLSKNIQELITSIGGEVKETDFWGRRQFAYELNGDTEGFYEVTNFDMNPKDISNLKTKLNLTEGLVRYLITAKS